LKKRRESKLDCSVGGGSSGRNGQLVEVFSIFFAKMRGKRGIEAGTRHWSRTITRHIGGKANQGSNRKGGEFQFSWNPPR